MYPHLDRGFLKTCDFVDWNCDRETDEFIVDMFLVDYLDSDFFTVVLFDYNDFVDFHDSVLFVRHLVVNLAVGRVFVDALLIMVLN